jgi:hypothetical protein
MLKRIKYISRFTTPLDRAAIIAIGEQASRKNQRLGLTGLLMTSGGLFYQVLEGPPAEVDAVYAAIAADERHTDVLLLASEEDVPSRLYPDWSMHTIDLDAAAHVRLFPLKALIKAVFEQQLLIANMMWAIERTVQHELRGAD